MNKLETISQKYETLKWMSHEEAVVFRKIIQDNKFKSICELGFYHGKGAVYLGAILEEQGFGTVTTFDKKKAWKKEPNIYELIKEFSLENYINVIETDEGYHWDLFQIIQDRRLTFDFCYIDGEHTFESTALAFYLIDQILEPNGIIVFDDYDWTIEKSLKMNPEKIKFFPHWLRATTKQKTSTGVKMVCDNLVIPRGYRQLEIEPKLDWKFFQKI